MKFKEGNFIYNIGFFLVTISMIPYLKFNNPYMAITFGLLASILVIDSFFFSIKYFKFINEKKYAQSFLNNINEFYDEMHTHFATTEKSYPDNGFSIAQMAYKQLMYRTDCIENEYRVYITKGAVKGFPHPHYWLTLFAISDVYFEHPFIIDVNTLRFKANRNMKFDNVMKEFRPIMLSETDKEFKNYHPFNFFETDESPMRYTKVHGRTVYFSSIEEDKISKTDFKAINDAVSKKISNNIIDFTK